jgi:hypothetical protein
MAESEIEVQGKVAYVPTSALLAFIFTVLSWLMEAVVWVLRWGSDGRYPDETRTVVSMVLTLGFTVWLIFQGKERRGIALQAMTGGRSLGVRPAQVLLVAASVLIFGGVFMVWLMTGTE